MRWLNGVLSVAVVTIALGACSSGSHESAPSDETVGRATAAITAACGFDTIGLPCDPDGPAGPKLECEGNCAIAVSGLATCQAVAAGTLDGVICGTANGIGDAACKRYCSGKTCLAGNAPEGAACRPTSKLSPCDGQCDGAGKCDNVGPSACEFGRDEQLCKFATCNFKDVSQCQNKNLTRNTLCSDQNVCSIGKCNALGVCVAGPTIGCDDGNACTDDSCDEVEGGCVGMKDDSNTCSDGNACTEGDYCSDGGCVAGTTAVVCNDGNACTTDSCDPNTGCAFVAKSCDDGDACTDDSCDPGSGACSHTVKVCNDDDSCTTDSCSSATGCVFTALDCDDDDACTADSCSGGVCGHAAVTCDDNDLCTTDSCQVATGCVFTPVPSCGAGGAGAGGEGNEPGGGGAPTGGGGEGPTTGGVPGEAGAPSSEGGAPTNEAGSPPVTPGGSAGSPQGGTAGGGTPSGGAAATAGAGAVGTGATAGSINEGGEGPDDVSRTVQSAGCGCRAAGTERSAPLGASALALLGLLVGRRRRRARV